MASLQEFNRRKVLAFYLVLVLLPALFISTYGQEEQQDYELLWGRKMLKDEEDDPSIFKEKTSSELPSSSSSYANKNKEKLMKTSADFVTEAKSQLKKQNPSSKVTKSTTKKGSRNNPDKKSKKPGKTQKQQPSWIDEDILVDGFRDLPTKFQETIVPDFHRITKSSNDYLQKYNKKFAKGFKPYVGNQYAPTIASILCFGLILIPLVLISLLFNRIKAYYPLQKLLIFTQVYLSIYFFTLCLSSWITGLEPLRFLYTTSQSTYMSVQVLLTLGYALYLVLILMYLVMGFSTKKGLTTKLLGLGQAFVGFIVGLHYYVVFLHSALLGQKPKTSWRIHALYATCFLVICLVGRIFDGRKKVYLEEGGKEGKKS